MWSPDRRTLLALLALGGCGFTPAYAPGGPGAALHGKVALRAPATLDEAALAGALRDRLGAEGGALTLDYAVRMTALPQATAPDGGTLRTALTGTARYTLSRAGAHLAAGEVSAMASFGAEGTPVATLASDAAARERLAAMLADRIVARLLAALA